MLLKLLSLTFVHFNFKRSFHPSIFEWKEDIQLIHYWH